MRSWRRPGRSQDGRGERGQAGIEFALVLPFLFVFLFLSAEGAYLLGTWVILDEAANAGARYAAVGHSTGDVQTCAAGAAGGRSVTTTVTGAQGTVGNQVTVKVSYTYAYPFSGFINAFVGSSAPASAAISATAKMRLEDSSATAQNASLCT